MNFVAAAEATPGADSDRRQMLALRFHREYANRLPVLERAGSAAPSPANVNCSGSPAPKAGILQRLSPQIDPPLKMISCPFGVQTEPDNSRLAEDSRLGSPLGFNSSVRSSKQKSRYPAVVLVERPNATVRPSGETEGLKSGTDFVGGEVKLRVSPVLVDNNIRPSVTTQLPSGNQAKRGYPTPNFVVGTSATMCSGPPMAGMTTKTARSFDLRIKPIERPSGENAGLKSSAGSVVRP